MSDIAIRSATASNYQGMIAMVGEDNRVYLGKPENCYLSPDGEAPAYYDNSDRSLRLISDNIRIFHFLYSRTCPCPSGRCAGSIVSPRRTISSLPACGRASSPTTP